MEGPGVLSEMEGPGVLSEVEGPGVLSEVEGPVVLSEVEGPGVLSEVEGPVVLSEVEGPGVLSEVEGTGVLSEVEGPGVLSEVEGPVVRDHPALPGVLSEMEGPPEQKLFGKFSLRGLRSYKMKEIFTWRLLKTVAMGQVLSLLICGTAVSCQYLADAGVDTPMFQSFLNYGLLLLVYTSALSARRGEKNLWQVLRANWWKYLVMGLSDVEANYTVVKAYQFTTLTSIQLLDCFVIPVLMLLSWFLLKTRYRVVHFVAVGVCLLGVGAMVGADILAGRDQGSTQSVLLGDALVLLSAALYAVSNVCQEDTVKRLSREQFLGMMGLFGTVFSGIQLAVLETQAVASVQWDLHIILLFALYALCMFALYSFMPVVVKMTSATAVNLSLLTADLFSLFCGVFLFHYNFSALYVVSFVVIIVGFVMFNAVPTYSALPEGGPDDEEAPEVQEVPGPERARDHRRRRAGPRTGCCNTTLCSDGTLGMMLHKHAPLHQKPKAALGVFTALQQECI
uniref:Solute carrier family 35 member F2 n=1 Tax=Neogobius melanostomus TaxID=47308 RepID=A0A8C6WMK7_9GOBI